MSKKIKTSNNNTLSLSCGGQMSLLKTDEIFQLAIPKLDLYNINARTKFGDNPLTFTQVIIQKQKYRQMDRQMGVPQMDRWTEGEPT